MAVEDLKTLLVFGGSGIVKEYIISYVTRYQVVIWRKRFQDNLTEIELGHGNSINQTGNLNHNFLPPFILLSICTRFLNDNTNGAISPSSSLHVRGWHTFPSSTHTLLTNHLLLYKTSGL